MALYTVMQKKDWVSRITEHIATGGPFVGPFVGRVLDRNKAPLIFACDVFRRRRHHVTLSLEPSQTGQAVLHVTVGAIPEALEFTVRRDQTAESILEEMSDWNIKTVTVRGCGTVINTVCQVVESAIHNGWFVEKNVLNTLTQTGSDNIKQRNTTLLVVLRRGSDIETI